MNLVIRTLTLIGVVSSGIASLAGYVNPAGRVTPLEQHPPRVEMPVEPASTTPKTDRLSLFDDRWDKMPTVAEIRTIPLEKPSPPIIKPEVQEPPSEPEVKSRRRHIEERERRDERPKNICERHHLRKVVSNGGRSWRCRR